jgi:hypothetical protein
MPKYTTSFNPMWLENENYKLWLQQDSNEKRVSVNFAKNPLKCLIDLFTMIRSLLQRCIKPDALNDCKTMSALLIFDLNKQSNFLSSEEIDLGFKAKAALRAVKKCISPRDALQLRMECTAFLLGIIQKVIEKSPLKSRLVRSLGWLQPKCISEDCSGCVKQLDITLNCLASLGRVSPDSCDSIKAQFIQWQSTTVSSNSAIFESFNSTTNRLDDFYNEYLGNMPDYTDLWQIVRLVLMLSHGQAAVERGFSINKETMTVNMAERTLIAKRCISDHLASIGGLQNVQVSGNMLAAAANARCKYRAYLEEKMKKKRQQITREKEMTSTRI